MAKYPQKPDGPEDPGDQPILQDPIKIFKPYLKKQFFRRVPDGRDYPGVLDQIILGSEDNELEKRREAKFVILDYPMLGDDSVTAAEASYCAEEQGRYFDYYDLLNEKHSGVQNGWANFDSLVGYAQDLGLDVESFDSCLFWDQQGLRVDHNRSVALAHGVVGTPTFFVVSQDGMVEKIVGAQPPMIFEAVIKEMS